jgi:hypothetical protein
MPRRNGAKFRKSLSSFSGSFSDSRISPDQIQGQFSAPIPDGRERPARTIRLFDTRESHAPNDGGSHLFFLCAPKALYSSHRFVNAVGRLALLPSNHARILLPHEMFSESEQWRQTFRIALAEVTECLVLLNPDDTIASGAWAELDWIKRPGSPLRYLAALKADDTDPNCNVLQTEGFFRQVPRKDWSWWKAARLHPPKVPTKSLVTKAPKTGTSNRRKATEVTAPCIGKAR